MTNTARALFVASILLFLSADIFPVPSAHGQPLQPAESDSDTSIQYQGYEAVIGMTSRAQALLVFDGRGDEKIAVMTGNFVPSPQFYLNTPFKLLGEEVVKGEKASRFGYYWKYSYNRFSLNRQEDPDTGGIGPASPVYNYGTRVEGDFFAVAPVFATEMLRPDGTVPFRIEVGLGVGYLNLAGDIVLGDQEGDPSAVKTDIEYNGLSLFIFTMGRHYRGSFMFGYQMGISMTTSRPYSFSQSYVSLDFGYRVLF